MDLSTRDAKSLVKIASGLRNERRVRILRELIGGPKSLSELFVRLANEIRYKDSLYRYLEEMVDIGLVDKKYDIRRKRLLYELKVDHITIDFR
jgi:DNA-binding transcriptional ArsR family regulator